MMDAKTRSALNGCAWATVIFLIGVATGFVIVDLAQHIRWIG
jgi:hypothetical protein